MAILRAHSAFDMRAVIAANASLTASPDRIEAVGATGVTTLTGDIAVTAWGATGTVTGYHQVIGSALVFTATGVQRSAATISDILGDRDNDRFLAYTLSGADVIAGSAAADYLIGFGGADTISGGAGNDRLFGGSDRDTLDGGAGNDFLAGGLDLDLMRGGAGNDTYVLAQAGDRVAEAAGAGTDTILSSVSLALPANVERLVLTGTAAISGVGGGGADTIDGNEAANHLVGGGGADRLIGDGGADVIEGGTGRDLVSGGRGADLFRFRTAAEAHGDRILDFRHGEDRVTFAAIDADETLAGNQAFRFIGAHAFTGRAGELTTAGTWLRGDLDGDKVADFVLTLGGDPVVTATDLIL